MKLLIIKMLCLSYLSSCALSSPKKLESNRKIASISISSCLSDLKEVLSRNAKKISEGSITPVARKQLEKLENTILETKASYSTASKWNYKEALANINDPNLKKGLEKVFDKMKDEKQLAIYVLKLMEDAFDLMLRSGDSKLVKSARKGKFSKESVIKVLEKRVSKREMKISTILPEEGSLNPKEFNKRISEGFLIDYGFAETTDHGHYVHLVQLDYIIEDIVKYLPGTSKEKYEHFFKFLGTEDGLKWWNVAFDNIEAPVDAKLFSPEFFNTEVLWPMGFKVKK